MGVEYQHCAIPKDPHFRPSAERIASFIRALAAERWILGPGDPTFQRMLEAGGLGKGTWSGPARKTGAMFTFDARAEPGPRVIDAAWLRAHRRGLTVGWPTQHVIEIGARYPLTRTPYDQREIYFELQLHWSRYYLPVVGETAQSREPTCRCGGRLDVPDPRPFDTAYHRHCGACGAPIDTARAITVFDSGPPRRLDGGGLHRFALVVDCGKAIPEEGPVALEPELMDLLSSHFNRGFNEIGLVC